MKSEPARCANPGARMLHLYGRFVPSLFKAKHKWIIGKEQSSTHETR